MSECKVESCDGKHRAKGLCAIHYDRERKRVGKVKLIKTCLKDGCGSHDVVPGFKHNRYCQKHFDELWLDPETPITHRHVSQFGYSIVTVMGKTAKEHRLIFERKLGRRLFPGENIHHIDGNRLNNELSNLELWSTSQPSGQRVSDKIRWANQIINRYGDMPNAF